MPGISPSTAPSPCRRKPPHPDGRPATACHRRTLSSPRRCRAPAPDRIGCRRNPRWPRRIRKRPRFCRRAARHLFRARRSPSAGIPRRLRRRAQHWLPRPAPPVAWRSSMIWRYSRNTSTTRPMASPSSRPPASTPRPSPVMRSSRCPNPVPSSISRRVVFVPQSTTATGADAGSTAISVRHGC